MKVCSFEDCDRKHKGRGLCDQHLKQQKAGKPLTPIRHWGEYGRVCTIKSCLWKIVSDNLCFEHFSDRLVVDNGICTSNGCTNQSASVNRVSCWSCVTLKSRHGITLDEAQKLWENQDYACANCRKEGPAIYTPCREWPVDHDHSCCPERGCGGCIRGIVCGPCNTGPLTAHVTKEVWESTGRYLGYV